MSDNTLCPHCQEGMGADRDGNCLVCGQPHPYARNAGITVTGAAPAARYRNFEPQPSGAGSSEFTEDHSAEGSITVQEKESAWGRGWETSREAGFRQDSSGGGFPDSGDLSAMLRQSATGIAPDGTDGEKPFIELEKAGYTRIEPISQPGEPAGAADRFGPEPGDLIRYPENPYNELSELLFHCNRHPNVIAQIGVSASGKSCSVNKLRYIAANARARRFVTDSPHCDIIPHTPRTHMASTVMTERSSGKKFQIIDCAGEDVTAGIKNFRLEGGDRARLSLEPRFQALLAHSRAYFLFIDSQGFFSDRSAPLEDGRPNQEILETERMLRFFIYLCGLIKVLENMFKDIDQENILETRALAEKRISFSAIREALMDVKNPSERPLYVIFSKADRIIKQRGLSEIDADPVAFIQNSGRFGMGLYNAVRDHFRHYHFDFATSFEGHPPSSGDRPDYSLPDHGVVETLEWVADILNEQDSLKEKEAAARQFPVAGTSFFDRIRWVGMFMDFIRPRPCSVPVKMVRKLMDR